MAQLINACPSFAPYHFSNSGLVNAKHFSYGFLGGPSIRIEFPNLPYQIRVNFFSNLIPARFSAFLNHVLVVIKNSAKPKMFWIYTRGIVSARAIMKHTHFVWDWPIEKNPRGSMSFHLARPKPSLSYVSIAFCVFVSHPIPTTVTNRNIFPKPFIESGREPKRFKKGISNWLRVWSKCEKFLLHNSDSLICATLSAATTARGHFYNTELIGGVNAA